MNKIVGLSFCALFILSIANCQTTQTQTTRTGTTTTGNGTDTTTTGTGTRTTTTTSPTTSETTTSPTRTSPIRSLTETSDIFTDIGAAGPGSWPPSIGALVAVAALTLAGLLL